MIHRFLILCTLGVAFLIGCNEAPYPSITEAPTPVHTGYGQCYMTGATDGPNPPDSISDLSFILRLDGLTQTNPARQKVCLAQTTHDQLPCLYYFIIETVRVDVGLIEITHLGYEGPQICQTDFGPARGSEGFELALGTYTLRFKNGSAVDEYELIADENTVTINHPHSGSYTTYDPPECCGDSVSVP